MARFVEGLADSAIMLAMSLLIIILGTLVLAAVIGVVIAVAVIAAGKKRD